MPKTIRLLQPQRQRLERLLHMEYTPGELARELECSAETVRRAIARGCPHRCDQRGHYWVVGDQFRAWYNVTHQKRSKQALGYDEGFCLSCRGVRQLVDVDRVEPLTQPGCEMVYGVCAVCGSKMRRIRRIRQESGS